MENKSWNKWNFQINWNKFEWVNPRSCTEGKNPLCVYSRKFCFKDNNKTAHWFGNSK